MRFIILFVVLICSLSLMSQTSKKASVNPVNVEDEGYYSDEERDPTYIEQNEEQTDVGKNDCNCETVQAQEEPPIYVIVPPPAPQPTPVPQQQVAPGYYKQFQSGNYQYESFEPMTQPTNQ